MKHDAICLTASDAATCRSRSRGLARCVQTVTDWEIDTFAPCSLNGGDSLPGTNA